VSNFNHDAAQKLFVANLEFREKYPQIFTNRDMKSPEIKAVIETV
jgi:hypothetical protein